MRSSVNVILLMPVRKPVPGIIDFNNNAIVALPEDIWQMTTLGKISYG